MKYIRLAVLLVSAFIFSNTFAADVKNVDVDLHQAEVITVPSDTTKAVSEDRSVVGVVEHNPKKISVVGKGIGKTSVKIMDGHKIIKRINVTVHQDLPAIKKALKTLLPDENIGVEMVNRTVALTGMVSSAEAAAKAVKITQEFVKGNSKAGEKVLNLMQMRSGQQVMLKVKVGEMKRDEIKKLGLGIHGIISGGQSVFGILESNGVFRTLAEPTLTAISGESAKFLAGGEFPVPVMQAGNTMSVDYKNFGVSVNFTPFVLSEKKIRLNVASEVSELSDKGAVNTQTMRIPAISTRRATTTIELAPGESFMIAGLIKNNTSANIHEVPALGDIPILNLLFRSAAFQRNESELVIAVTPYMADPVEGRDIQLPGDGYQFPSMMEMFMLGRLQGNKTFPANTPNTQNNSGLEGRTGFTLD